MPHDHPVDDGPPTQDEIVATLVFAADAGQQMLESSPSVSEVIGRLRAFMIAVGLPECEVDATMSALTLSYWRPGLPAPVTVMRSVEVSNPRLGRLSGTLGLLNRLQQGRTDVAAAARELHILRTTPGRPLRFQQLAILVSVAGWVVYLNGFSLWTVLVALLGTLLAAPVMPVIQRLDLPWVFGTALSAVVIAAVPNLVAAAGVTLVVGSAVVGALFVYLPGVAVVSSVIDGLSNAPLSAVARAISAAVTAGALALGMLVGASLGKGFGLKYQLDATSVPLPVSLAGAIVGMGGLALAWDTPRRALAPTLLMGSAGWVLFASFAQRGSGSDWFVYLLAAALVGIIGQAAATRQNSATSVYLGVSILPLVPGFTLYQAMLALAQGEPGAGEILGRVALISMALASGVAVGVALGRYALQGRRVLVRHLPAAGSAVRRSQGPDGSGEARGPG
jgi:uncharacterized membrane protein YjjP (DUF1212 family)